MTKKQMKEKITGWLKDLPGREWNKSIILSIGSKYVHVVPLYLGPKIEHIEIEEFFEDHKFYM